ncbi:hypothetical protein [Gemmatimonas sp.]|uniref:hypothetical protein n=1 Tax=Gemmatimonas sp. TaxID=1962908 RepID=UPI002627BC9D|nr:hypothetical protein [Gemmatimonas sp.]
MDSLFPLASSLERMAEAGGQSLSNRLLTALRRAGVPVTIGLADRAGLALALAFDEEYRSVEAVQGVGFKIVTTLSAQLLTIDFRDGFATVLSALPSVVEYVDVQQARPGPSYTQRVADAILPAFMSEDATGQFATLARGFAALPAPGSAICRVQLGEVSFDSVTTRLASPRFGTDTARLRAALAREAARTWVTAARQPLLPTRSSQVQGQMQTRFANGDIYRLRVPEPDYVLAIDNLAARRQVAGQNAALRVDAVGLQLEARVTVPGSPTPLVRGVYRHVTLDTIPQLRTDTDTWSGLVNSLAGLTAKLAIASRSHDQRWFDSADVTRSSFPSLPAWINKCAP